MVLQLDSIPDQTWGRVGASKQVLDIVFEAILFDELGVLANLGPEGVRGDRPLASWRWTSEYRSESLPNSYGPKVLVRSEYRLRCSISEWQSYGAACGVKCDCRYQPLVCTSLASVQLTSWSIVCRTG